MEEATRGNRKIKKGVVISNKMQKTVVVSVDSTFRHAQYGKVVTRRNKFYAHHEGLPLEVGAQVQIMETRPMSKLKRWRVLSNE